MALNSSDVSGGDTALASQYNSLIDDVEQHTHDGTDTALISILNDTIQFDAAVTRYYSVSVYDFTPYSAALAAKYDGGNQDLRSLDTTITAGYIGLHLPNGAIVTSFKVYWYRDDAVATGDAELHRTTLSTIATSIMATADSDATTGDHSVEDTSISDATIDNTAYAYGILVGVNPNDAAADVRFNGAVITYTILKPLP